MISWSETILRLSLAAIFGAAIGLERERKDWAAGMRTHMMVCVGSTLAMMVSEFGFADVLGSKNIVLDPSRIAAQVISGIGFLGAGTILFLKQGIIRGLTTASGLWTVAAIGLATGGGMYFAAVITTLLAIIILWFLQPVEKRFALRFRQKSIRIITTDSNKATDIANKIIQIDGEDVIGYTVDKTDNEYLVAFRFRSLKKTELKELITELQSDAQIKEIVWTK
jgi:putative Mg2+ transporter-C (MgtC) family protein